MNVETILLSKGRTVVTISRHDTVATAVRMLNDDGIGALVVSEDGKSIDGILSERDIVLGLVGHGADLLSYPVGHVMTRRVITCAPADSIAELMATMTNRRVRHLPVVGDGQLCGIVSIGDLVKHRLDELEDEARSMRSFVAGA